MSFTSWSKLSLKLRTAQHLKFPEPQGNLCSDQCCSWEHVLQRSQELALNRTWFSHLSFATSGVSRNAGRVSSPAHTINCLSFLLPQTSLAEELRSPHPVSPVTPLTEASAADEADPSQLRAAGGCSSSPAHSAWVPLCWTAHLGIHC